MQQIDCTRYPLIGKLISQAVRYDKKIHRSILMSNENGRITIYYSDETCILECDTNGDHIPNSYYFFSDVEHKDINHILTKMSIVLGEQYTDHQIRTLADQTMIFLKTI